MGDDWVRKEWELRQRNDAIDTKHHLNGSSKVGVDGDGVKDSNAAVTVRSLHEYVIKERILRYNGNEDLIAL